MNGDAQCLSRCKLALQDAIQQAVHVAQPRAPISRCGASSAAAMSSTLFSGESGAWASACLCEPYDTVETTLIGVSANALQEP